MLRNGRAEGKEKEILLQARRPTPSQLLAQDGEVAVAGDLYKADILLAALNLDAVALLERLDGKQPTAVLAEALVDTR